MTDCRWSIRAWRGLALAFGLVVTPSVVRAHDVAGTRFETPLPLSWLYVGAGATVALTALWLAVSDHTLNANENLTVTVSASLVHGIRYVSSTLFAVVFTIALVTGVTGRQVAAENPATVFTWSVWFHCLAILAVVIGNPWATLSPWRTVYRALCTLEGRTLSRLSSYPAWLQSWPALVGFVCLIGILENLTVIPRSPRLTAVILALYMLGMVLGAIAFGPTWFDRADPLSVLYRLFGRMSPLDLSQSEGRGYEVTLRWPWHGCLERVASPSLVFFVVAMVYTVSFDGFTDTRSFQRIWFTIRELGGPGASIVLYGFGFAVFLVAFWVAAAASDRLGGLQSRDVDTAMRRFVPSLLPIAAAYEVAHTYPYILRNLGLLPGVLLQPVLPGLGQIELLGWLSLPVFWASQVGLIVVGHVVAVVAAHHIAVERYGSLSAGRRAHLPLVVVMVGYTVLSLWIVSQPIVAG